MSPSRPSLAAELLARGRAAGLAVRAPGAAEAASGFPESPAHDYGKFIERLPGCVFAPTSHAELDACVGLLVALGAPFKVRGGAHCSGGQSLIEGGALVDLRGLARVVGDWPGEGAVAVDGGATWLALCDHLRPQGRAPRVLTMNWRTTVAGTLTTGGFGDTSHRDGPQPAMVRGLEVLGLDGRRRRVTPGDALFDYSLAGRGQLGIITEVTLATARRSSSLAARAFVWPTFGDYLHDLPLLDGEGGYDVVRARIAWARGRVRGAAGHFVGADGATPGAPAGMRGRPGHPTVLDYDAAGAEPPNRHWIPACPAMEVVLPVSAGAPGEAARLLEELRAQVLAAGLEAYLTLGSAVVSVPPAERFPHLPLAPLLRGSRGLLVALRPEMPVAAVPRYLPALEGIGRWCYQVGGKLYLVGVEPPGLVDLERQFGEALPTFLALRAAADPRGLLNGGLLPA